MLTESDINHLDSIYFQLSSLIRSDPWLHSCVDDFRDFYYDYFESEHNPLSTETKQQFFLFLENLNTNLKENSFSPDQSFVYLDKNWHVLLI